MATSIFFSGTDLIVELMHDEDGRFMVSSGIDTPFDDDLCH